MVAIGLCIISSGLVIFVFSTRKDNSFTETHKWPSDGGSMGSWNGFSYFLLQWHQIFDRCYNIIVTSAISSFLLTQNIFKSAPSRRFLANKHKAWEEGAEEVCCFLNHNGIKYNNCKTSKQTNTSAMYMLSYNDQKKIEKFLWEFRLFLFCFVFKFLPKSKWRWLKICYLAVILKW